jgi:hypothetical protein
MAKVKVELTIPSDLKDKPIFHTMCCEYKVIPNIIEASFSTSMGWAILTIEGKKEEVERLLNSLRENRIAVKIL